MGRESHKRVILAALHRIYPLSAALFAWLLLLHGTRMDLVLTFGGVLYLAPPLASLWAVSGGQPASWGVTGLLMLAFITAIVVLVPK